MPSKLLDYLNRGGAALRTGVYAAQKSDKPISDFASSFIDQLGRPSDEAPTGADIAENAGLSDDQVLTKTALATIADLADPTPIGKALKALKGGAALAGAAGLTKLIPPEKAALMGVKSAFPAKKGLSAAEALLEAKKAGRHTAQVPNDIENLSQQLRQERFRKLLSSD